MRAFFAVEIPKEIKEEILIIINRCGRLKWTKKENLHITVRFLGDIDEEEISTIIAAIPKIKSFTIKLNSLALFPNEQNPIALVLKLAQEDKISSLNKVIEEAVVSCGLAPETKPFLPHLTLAKTKSLLLPPSISLPNLEFTVNNIQLWQSDAGNYIPLVCIPMVQ